MTPIENIALLFKKDFVEHPLIESYNAGNLHLSSGYIVACDPIITNDMAPFEQKFPKGAHPAIVHKEKESQCIAYIEIIFDKKYPTQWKLATTKGQNIKELVGDEIFGYPVQSGMGCLMDWETQNELNILEQNLFQRKGAEKFMGIYEEFFQPYFLNEKGSLLSHTSLVPNTKKNNNIIAFETGYGEGFYASYIGYSTDGYPVKLVSEFIEIKP